MTARHIEPHIETGTRGLLLVLALAGCTRSSLLRDGEEADDDAASGKLVGSEIARRNCARPSLGDGWTLPSHAPCRSHEDCVTKANGSCIGLPSARCEYSTGQGAVSDNCEHDSDCIAGEGGHCPQRLASTFCLYEACRSDADCGFQGTCLCSDTYGGDHYCVDEGCRTDTDCSPGQHCQEDESITNYPPIWHCTTATDTCRMHSDCTGSVDNYCGYDLEKHSWVCRPQTHAF